MIAVHLTYSGPGGLSSYLRDFINSDLSNHFNHVVVFYGVEPLHHEMSDFCTEKGIKFYYLKRENKIDFRNYRKVWDIVISLKASAVFLHTYSLSPFYYFRKRTFKLMCFEHTSLAFKGIQERVYSFINWQFADFIIVFFKNHSVHKRFSKKVKVVEKKVDTREFSNHNRCIPNGELVIGMSSRLVKGKRVDLIISAIELLVKENVKVTLKVAGGGAFLNELKVMAQDKGVEKEVTFLGQISRNELSDFYNSLDAYIHASEGETMCYSIMEAQASGLPILASRVCGIKEFLTDREDALLFENRFESIAEMIKDLSMINGLWDKLSANSLMRSKTTLKTSSIADNIYNLLNE